ncbi:SCO family protein [Metabacillus iocasae]|uniref:Protein SCO1/2 n=1 Tax=Priestia iocasae TaxID=2291674 RepID=A0ABS2QUM7_9BACI|nr:SCO family protein [Metabacillus iocasae]MBM7703198.1 protein SCO1/2 [Metabacillus iocasae]
MIRKHNKQFLAGMMILLLVALTACNSDIPDRLDWELDDFSYVNQEGDTVSKESLKGDIWVADFIFTNCETVCPPMTANMAKLQKMAEEEGLDVRFVSFSVDPEVDSPERLKEFASQFNTDLSKWDFLTGYKQDEIQEFALDNFKTIVQKPKDEDQVIHQTSFYLVDQEGKVVKDYSGVSDTPYEEIIEHIKTLQK